MRLASRLIALDKNPGVRPIGIDDTARRIITKAILDKTKKQLALCSFVQVRFQVLKQLCVLFTPCFTGKIWKPFCWLMPAMPSILSTDKQLYITFRDSAPPSLPLSLIPPGPPLSCMYRWRRTPISWRNHPGGPTGHANVCLSNHSPDQEFEGQCERCQSSLVCW